jgi:hypothetical protein
MYCALAGYYLKLFYKICFINLDPSSDLHADVMSLESTRHQPREAPAPMWAASSPAGGKMSLSDGKGRTARKAMHQRAMEIWRLFGERRHNLGALISAPVRSLARGNGR